MTVVVADTSPLNYLLLIGQIEILPGLYGKVLVPPEVLAELADGGRPSPGVELDSPTARVAASTGGSRRSERPYWRKRKMMSCYSLTTL